MSEDAFPEWLVHEHRAQDQLEAIEALEPAMTLDEWQRKLGYDTSRMQAVFRGLADNGVIDSYLLHGVRVYVDDREDT